MRFCASAVERPADGKNAVSTLLDLSLLLSVDKLIRSLPPGAEAG